MADEWFVGIISICLVAQVLLEYFFFREAGYPEDRSSCGSPMSNLSQLYSRSNSVDRRSSVDPAPLLQGQPGEEHLSVDQEDAKRGVSSLPEALARICELEDAITLMQAQHQSLMQAQSARVQELQEELESEQGARLKLSNSSRNDSDEVAQERDSKGEIVTI